MFNAIGETYIYESFKFHFSIEIYLDMKRLLFIYQNKIMLFASRNTNTP